MRWGSITDEQVINFKIRGYLPSALPSVTRVSQAIWSAAAEPGSTSRVNAAYLVSHVVVRSSVEVVRGPGKEFLLLELLGLTGVREAKLRVLFNHTHLG